MRHHPWRPDARRRRLRLAVLAFVALALASSGGSGWTDRPMRDGFDRSSGWLD